MENETENNIMYDMCVTSHSNLPRPHLSWGWVKEWDPCLGTGKDLKNEMMKREALNTDILLFMYFICVETLTNIYFSSLSVLAVFLLKFGFIKRVDKCWITTVKDLESWRFER